MYKRNLDWLPNSGELIWRGEGGGEEEEGEINLLSSLLEKGINVNKLVAVFHVTDKIPYSTLGFIGLSYYYLVLH